MIQPMSFLSVTKCDLSFPHLYKNSLVNVGTCVRAAGSCLPHLSVTSPPKSLARLLSGFLGFKVSSLGDPIQKTHSCHLTLCPPSLQELIPQCGALTHGMQMLFQSQNLSPLEASFLHIAEQRAGTF